MYSYVFKEKLKKLNSSLYLKEDNAVARLNDHRATGIYSRIRRRDESKSNYHQLAADAEKWLSARESGNMDTFITGCPTGWIPEHDVFDIETGRVLSKGWRTIVLFLVKERLCSLERARIVFSPSLGESDFDKASFEKRVQMARKAAGWKSVQERIAAYA